MYKNLFNLYYKHIFLILLVLNNTFCNSLAKNSKFVIISNSLSKQGNETNNMLRNSNIQFNSKH